MHNYPLALDIGYRVQAYTWKKNSYTDNLHYTIAMLFRVHTRQNHLSREKRESVVLLVGFFILPMHLFLDLHLDGFFHTLLIANLLFGQTVA